MLTKFFELLEKVNFGIIVGIIVAAGLLYCIVSMIYYTNKAAEYQASRNGGQVQYEGAFSKMMKQEK